MPETGAQSLVVHFTHLCFGKNYFCTGQTQGLYPESAVPNCPFISHMLPVCPFHTFLLWKNFFLHRASPSTLPGGGRSHVVHSFYTSFSSGGAHFCTGRARQLHPVTAILPLIHSFISPRFCSGENFFSPEQPINLNRWGSFVPRRSLPAAARFTLQIHFFHDYVRHFRPSSIPSYMPSFRFGRPSQNHPAWLWEPTHITNIAHRKHCSPFRPRCARPDTHIPLSPHRVL